MKNLASVILMVFFTFLSYGLYAQDQVANAPSLQNLSSIIFLGKNIISDPEISPMNIISTGDTEIQGSLGIGEGITDDYDYGFNTFVLRENILRILFDDANTGSLFPSNDWSIVINDVNAGQADFFGIDDITAGTRPFRIDAGAGDHALYVESSGFVGLGTNNPEVNLHVTDMTAPSIRLEQSDSTGTQSWDIVGSADAFEINDDNTGRRPFRIESGATSNSIYVKSNGHVGFGNADPKETLHVNFGDSPALRLDQDGTSGFTEQVWDVVGNEANFFIRDATHNNVLPFRIKPGGNNENALFITENGSIGMSAGNEVNPNSSLELGADNKGLQLNRMSTENRTTLGNALGANEVGVIVYDTEDAQIYLWNGTVWQAMTTVSACASPMYQVTNAIMGTAATTSLKLLGFDAPKDGATGYVIYINDSNTFVPPADGDTIEVNTVWTNNGQQAVYFNTSEFSNLSITGLTADTEYFLIIFAYNDCNGTSTYETTGFSFSASTESTSAVDMLVGVGINTETPSSALDVDGSVRALNRTSSGTLYKCEAAVEGNFGYDTQDKRLKVCTDVSGTFEWRALSFDK